MVSVDKAYVVRYKVNGKPFEVLVDFDKLQKFKKEKGEMSVYDVLADYKIFKDEKKGEVASENELKEIFRTNNEEEIFKIILMKGDCQIPTSYLNKLRDEKKQQIINYIVENAINGSTRMKFTPSLIEKEVSQLKYNFNYEEDTLKQAREILKLLKKKIPIVLEKLILDIKVPPEYVGNFYGKFRNLGKIQKEYYDQKGNLRLHMEILQSSFDSVENFIRKNSNNSAEYFVLEKIRE